MSANKLNDKTAIVVSLLGVGASLYWMFTYSGPYRYLAELQLKLFGWYVPKLTMLVIVLGFLAIAAVIKAIFRGAERPAPTMPQPQTTAPAQPATAPAANLPPYWRVAFFVVPLGLGCWMYFNAVQAGQLRQLNVADFGNGRVTSRVLYADIRGHLGESYMMKDNYYYIPMLASDGSPERAHVLIGVNKNQIKNYLHRDADGSFNVRGMVDRNLEGDMRAAFEKNKIPLAETVWVLHTGRDPVSDQKLGLGLIGFSIVVGALLGVLLANRAKKAALAQPAPAVAASLSRQS